MKIFKILVVSLIMIISKNTYSLPRPDLRPALTNVNGIIIDPTTCDLKILVKNEGSIVSAPSFATIQWISSNGTPNTVSVYVPSIEADDQEYSSIIPNAKFISSVDNVPFTIVVDANQDIMESNEGNNLKSIVWSVGPNLEEGQIPPGCVERADYIISATNWDPSNCSLEVKVKNIGLADVQLQTSYVDIKGIRNLLTNQEGFTYSAVPPLKKQEEHTFTITGYGQSEVNQPALSTADESYNFPGGIITESEETNNSLVSSNAPSNCIAPVNNNCGYFGINSANYLIHFDINTGIPISSVQLNLDSMSSFKNIAIYQNVLYLRDNDLLYSVNSNTGEKFFIANIGRGFGMGSSDDGLVMDVFTFQQNQLKVIVYNPKTKSLVREFLSEANYAAHDFSHSPSGQHKVTTFLNNIEQKIYDFNSLTGAWSIAPFQFSSNTLFRSIEEVAGISYGVTVNPQVGPFIYSAPPPAQATPVPAPSIIMDTAYGCINNFGEN